MTVRQFEKKYTAIQSEASEIYSELKPLLARMKKIAKRSSALAQKIDADTDLYVKAQFGYLEKGWNYSILFRLSDFDYLLGDGGLAPIDAVFYNILHTKFSKKAKRRSI